MFDRITKLNASINSIKRDLVNHKLFNSFSTELDLQLFMKNHVYAVWDFMSLLKVLQQELTRTEIPWFPKGSAETRYLINEIVCGEESDIDENGKRCSHFELYLNAMKSANASTSEIELFVNTLMQTGDLEKAFEVAKTSDSVKNFVNFTFEIIRSRKLHLIAAVFTFAREDLIPGMFRTLVDDLNLRFPEKYRTFKYYLDRHIEIDGEHHSHLAMKMTTELCGNDESKWIEAENAVIQALEMRKTLWDGILEKIISFHIVNT